MLTHRNILGLLFSQANKLPHFIVTPAVGDDTLEKRLRASRMTVAEAIQAIQGSRDVEMVFYLYVVDGRRHLVGVVSLRRLLLVSPDTPLKRIMTADVISVRVETDQEDVARQVASYNLLAIPVVDEENKLVGVITVDDVIDVIKDEATEDIYRLAGLASDERVFTPPVEGKLVQGWEGLEVGDRLRVKLIGTDVERGFIDFVRSG